MANGNAAIGALRVAIGLDSAQFSAGLAKSQASLAKFGKAATIGLAAVTAAATAASVALGVALKNSVDRADNFNDLSKMIGISTEALSRLDYAAGFSGVSLDQLSIGLKKLNLTMAEAAANSESGPASAFAALGVDIRDAAGNLRDNDAVFASVAEAFSHLQDGATKASLAVQLFGKSGVDLVPLLNVGADGLRRFADESDRTNNTISTKTAQAADAFNDSMAEIGKGLQGVTNKIISDEGLQKSVADLAAVFSDPNTLAGIAGFGTAMAEALATVARAAAAAFGWLQNIKDFVQEGLNGSEYVSQAGIEQRVKDAQAKLKELKDMLGDEHAQAVAGVYNINGAIADANAELEKYIGLKKAWDAMTPAAMDGVGSTLPGFDTFLSQFKDHPIIPKIDTTAAIASLEPLDLGLQETTDHVTTLAETITDSLGGALEGIAKAFLTGGDAAKAFQDAASNLAGQLLDSGLHTLISSILGGGNPLASLFGGGTPYVPGFGSVGVFAGGGISNAPAIFGEAGPEAAVPLPDGRTIPVTLSGDTGGTVNHFYIDAKGAELGVEAKIVKAIKATVPGMINDQAPLAVMKYQRNRG